jgi:hypothetical protein
MGSASSLPYIYFQQLHFSQPLAPMHLEWHYYSALCTLYVMSKWRWISTVILFIAEPTRCTFFCVLSASFLNTILRGWYERRNFEARDTFLLLDSIYVPLPIFFACLVNTCRKSQVIFVFWYFKYANAFCYCSDWFEEGRVEQRRTRLMWKLRRVLAASSFSSSELHKVWPPFLFLGTILIKWPKTQICLRYLIRSAACLTLLFLDELLELYWCISALYDCTVCGLFVPKSQSIALTNLKKVDQMF